MPFETKDSGPQPAAIHFATLQSVIKDLRRILTIAIFDSQVTLQKAVPAVEAGAHKDLSLDDLKVLAVYATHTLMRVAEQDRGAKHPKDRGCFQTIGKEDLEAMWVRIEAELATKDLPAAIAYAQIILETHGIGETTHQAAEKISTQYPHALRPGENLSQPVQRVPAIV